MFKLPARTKYDASTLKESLFSLAMRGQKVYSITNGTQKVYFVVRQWRNGALCLVPVTNNESHAVSVDKLPLTGYVAFMQNLGLDYHTIQAHEIFRELTGVVLTQQELEELRCG